MYTVDGGTDVNPFKKTVELDRRSLSDPESREVREMTGYRPEEAGEALGKPRVSSVGMLAPERHILNLLCFSHFVIEFILRVWLFSYKCDVVCMLFM